MTTSPGAAGIDSDDFQSGGTLAALWTPYTADGGSVAVTGQGTANAFCTITSPSGTARYFWSADGYTAPRISQSCTDASFDIEVKLETVPTANGQEMGIYMLNGAGTVGYSFGLYYDTQLNWYHANYTSASTINSGTTSLTAPAYMRFRWETSADSNACYLSDDGTFASYPAGAVSSTTLTSYAPASVGVFCANFLSGTTHALNLDYFFELTAVIDPEDDVASATRRIMVIT